MVYPEIDSIATSAKESEKKKNNNNVTYTGDVCSTSEPVPRGSKLIYATGVA